MTPEIRDYFTSLCKRAGADTAVPVSFVSVSDVGWVPSARACHANADRWASLKPARKVVRGWLIGATDGAGGYLFIAHSVVEECGELHDITPADSFPDVVPLKPEPPRLFLRHEGSLESFDAMLPQCNSVSFNPFM